MSHDERPDDVAGHAPTGDAEEIAAELRRALTTVPRTLPPRWLYDDRGSELFSRITELDEYYPTEAERRILADRSGEIAEVTGATTVVELGSGTSDKTRTLLDAFADHGRLTAFAPLDVSEATLLEAAEMLRARHPEMTVTPIVGDFTRHLSRISALASSGPLLVLFLGGTLGNFYVGERAAFLRDLHDALSPGDWALVGMDQVKDADRLVAAYDDGEGVTELFIRNALVNVNSTYGGDIDVGRFDYVPLWDPRAERIDMRLRASDHVSARIEGLGVDLEVAAGEEIRVEISSKFRPPRLLDELAAAGFGASGHRVYTDPDDDFALLLVRRDAPSDEAPDVATDDSTAPHQ
ncbi:L-histidine N(alpha)-methyltransferase [Ilumatobacter sp.]|uniref:L-histidine N(alpha)-methyltransferase n=1 Tax=Ilumatobacter sp. TaxID=1967498 RepID=UPI003B526F6A